MDPTLDVKTTEPLIIPEKLIKETESQESPESGDGSEELIKETESQEEIVETTEKLKGKTDADSTSFGLNQTFWDKYKVYLFGVVIISLLYLGYMYFFVYTDSKIVSAPLEPFYESSFMGTINKEMKESLVDTVSQAASSVVDAASTAASSVVDTASTAAASVGNTGST